MDLFVLWKHAMAFHKFPLITAKSINRHSMNRKKFFRIIISFSIEVILIANLMFSCIVTCCWGPWAAHEMVKVFVLLVFLGE